MRLVVFSDLHIAHKMVDDEILENLFIDISSNVNNETIICFTGDLFHKKVDLHDIYAQQGVTLFKKIDELNVPVIVVEGTFSHDYQYIDTFKKIGLDNFTFVQTLTELKDFKNNIGETLDILCIPEEYIEDQNEYYKDTVYNANKIYDLVLMHGTFTDVLFHNVHIEAETLRKAPKFDSKDFKRHTLTLSGHIHKHQVLGKSKNVIYVGSYANMNFGDDKSNNLVIVDLNKNEKNFQFRLVENIKSHSFVEVELNEDISYEDFESKYLNMFKNRSSRTHYKVFYDGSDETIKNVLKQLRKDNVLNGLSLSNKKLENKEILEQQESDGLEDYSKIYSGKLEDQIQTFIKNNYDKEISTDTIYKILS